MFKLKDKKIQCIVNFTLKEFLYLDLYYANYHYFPIIAMNSFMFLGKDMFLCSDHTPDLKVLLS